MKLSAIGILGCSIFGAVSIHTASYASTLADDIVGELYQMKSVYSAEYAPAHWKASYANYSLDAQFKIALDAVQSTLCANKPLDT